MTKPNIDWDKPFEAFLESGAVLNARLLSSDYKRDGLTFRVVQVEHAYRSEVCTYYENGTPRYNAPLLRNKVKKVTKWYNLYADRPGFVYFDNEESARGSVWENSPPLATLPIEFEEPE